MGASRGRTTWLCLALLGAVAIVYAQVREHDFVSLDDRAFLVENVELERGLGADGLAWAFRATTDGNWIPLTWISFLVDQELHGLAPGSTHLTNVVLHGLSSILLLLALLRLTGSLGPSAFTAAAFALHPLHVESVAWAIERKDVVSGLAFHAALLAHAAFALRGGWVRYAVLLLCSAAGLLAKPMLVTLPFVLLLLDAWPLRRLRTRAGVRAALLEKVPLLVLAASVSVVTLETQALMGGLQQGLDLSLATRLANAAVSYASYPLLALWPVHLGVFYPHPGDTLSAGVVAASVLALLVASALCVREARRRPYLLVGWLWYLGMLVPVIGIVQAGHQAMADRYAYLPLTGLVLALAWGGHELAARGPRPRAVVATSAVLAVGAMAWLSTLQVRHWRNSTSLFEHALEVAPERNGVAHNALGFEWLERGEVDRAIDSFRRALELQPELLDARANLGGALLRAGRTAESIPHLEHALGLVGARRASALENLGLARQQSGELERAIEHYREAIEVGGPSARRHLAVATALVALARYDEAGRDLERAAELGLDPAEQHATWAQLEQARGRDTAAVARYRQALALRPDWLLAQNNLAWLHATSKDPRAHDPGAAVRLAERAASATGHREPAVLDTLAVAYASAGRAEEARRTAERAATLARARGEHALAREIEARLAGPESPAPPAE